MAGDWIKMRSDLATDPAVIAIAAKTGLDEFGVVGRLHSLWAWADSQTLDGNAVGVTESFLDRYLGVTGMARAMVSVGWLEVNSCGLRIPHFDRHNGQTAKARALTAKRVAKFKDQKGNGYSVTEALPREEKRRVNTPYIPQGGRMGSGSGGSRKDRRANRSAIAAAEAVAAVAAARGGAA